MNIILKDKIKIDATFINDLITKSWQDSESIQNQINSIETDSPQATKVVKLLKDLLTSYYVFTGCLENIENETTGFVEATPVVEPKHTQKEEPVNIPEKPVTNSVSDIAILSEFDSETAGEPFEYFVDFDEPSGEPISDQDLYN